MCIYILYVMEKNVSKKIPRKVAQGLSKKIPGARLRKVAQGAQGRARSPHV